MLLCCPLSLFTSASTSIERKMTMNHCPLGSGLYRAPRRMMSFGRSNPCRGERKSSPACSMPILCLFLSRLSSSLAKRTPSHHSLMRCSLRLSPLWWTCNGSTRKSRIRLLRLCACFNLAAALLLTQEQLWEDEATRRNQHPLPPVPTLYYGGMHHDPWLKRPTKNPLSLRTPACSPPLTLFDPPHVAKGSVATKTTLRNGCPPAQIHFICGRSNSWPRMRRTNWRIGSFLPFLSTPTART